MIINEATGKSILVPVIINTGKINISVIAPLHFPAKPKSIFKIMDVVENISTELCNDKVIIDAVLHKYILFHGDCSSSAGELATAKLQCLKNKTPFQGFINIAGVKKTDTVVIDKINICESKLPTAHTSTHQDSNTLIEIIFIVTRRQLITLPQTMSDNN